MPIASMGWTKPEAGVMATRPATAPAAAPITLALPASSQLANIQDRAAAAAGGVGTRQAAAARAAGAGPVLVTTKALAAWPLAAPALPALKPNQPNQRMAAPRTM